MCSETVIINTIKQFTYVKGKCYRLFTSKINTFYRWVHIYSHAACCSLEMVDDFPCKLIKQYKLACRDGSACLYFLLPSACMWPSELFDGTDT